MLTLLSRWEGCVAFIEDEKNAYKVLGRQV
jgi:hypothetical protein